MASVSFHFLRSPKFRAVAVTLLTIGVLYAIVLTTRSMFFQSPNATVEEEIRATTNAVGKLMELPAEKPTVATVSDVAKLPPYQPFFKDAKNGDKALFYNDAKKAILYRPETNKIINIAPITVNLNTQ